MLNAEIDLLDGQLSRFDKVPVSYSSPIGQFRGTGYDTKKVPAEPTYEKLSSHKETFLNPKTFSYDTKFMLELQQFIYALQPVYVYPTNTGTGEYVGVGHKLQSIESANKMMAFRNGGFLPLDNVDVQQVIKNNFNALQVSPTSPYTPLSAYDTATGITVISFKNGVVTEIINQIYKVDIAEAINIVQRQVTVPVNRRQLLAIISLVYEVKGKRLYNSQFLKVLNGGHYNKTPSYFMEFSESVLPSGETAIDENIYNRRLTEAELFSSVLQGL